MNIEEYISSGIIENYVLGVTSPEENQEVEDMAKTHPEIKAAITSYRKVMEEYGRLHAVNPPPALRSKVMNALSLESLKESAPATTPIENISLRRLYTWRRIAAVALILLVISLIANAIFIEKYQQYKEQYFALQLSQQQLLTQNQLMEARLDKVENDLQVLMNPDMKPVVMQGVNDHPGMAATVYWDPQSRKAYLTTTNLPAPPSGKTYQLWAIVDGKPVDMGIYDPSKNKGPKAMKNVKPGEVAAFAITLEKQGGSPTPTMDQMYVMGKLKAKG